MSAPSPTVLRLAKKALVSTMSSAPATQILRWLYGGNGAILGFHRVLPEDAPIYTPGHTVGVSQLDEILGYLTRTKWKFVPLDEIPDRIRSGSREKFVAFTLDDGFADNLVHGMPIFEKWEAPFALFPVTGLLNRRVQNPWFIVETLVPRVASLTTRLPSGEVQTVAASSFQEKSAALEMLHEAFDRSENLTGLAEAASDAGYPVPKLWDLDLISWEQLKSAATHPLVTVGVHSVSHPMLAQLTEEDAFLEMTEAKAELERNCGHEIRHIAYPGGSPAACGDREFRLARDAGFLTGYTTARGNVYSSHAGSLHALPRHSLSIQPHSSDVRYLKMSLAGFWDSPLNNSFVSRYRQ